MSMLKSVSKHEAQTKLSTMNVKVRIIELTIVILIVLKYKLLWYGDVDVIPARKSGHSLHPETICVRKETQSSF